MNYKYVAIIIFIICISVISGIYYLNQLPPLGGPDTPSATVVFYQEGNNITMNVTSVEKGVNNISIHYNNTVIADNLIAGDTVMLSEYSCNNTIYVYHEEQDGLKEISSYPIICVD